MSEKSKSAVHSIKCLHLIVPAGHHLVEVPAGPIPPLAELRTKYQGGVYGFFDGRRIHDTYELDGTDRTITGTGGYTVFLPKKFDVGMSSEDAIRWGLSQRTLEAPSGYRPATAKELDCFLGAHPEFDGSAPVVALGSCALDVDGSGIPDYYVAALDRNSGGRYLAGRLFHRDCYPWRAGHLFLYVRIEP